MSRVRSSRRGVTGRLLSVLLVLTFVAAACAPAASTVVPPAPTVAQPKPPTPPAPTSAVSVPTSDLPVGVSADGHFYRGRLDAPVTFVEYSDFECPFCSRHAVQTGPLIDKTYISTGQVLHYFRNFPIPELGHTNAVSAAQAAYCAGQQAPKYFWAMHDWLFASQSEWSGNAEAPKSFRQQAITFGVEGGAYDACLTAQSTTDAITQDLAEGRALGVSGTPAFFVNDWFVSGAQPFSEFQKAIDKAVQGIHPPPTPTPLPQGINFFDADPGRPGLTYDGSPTRGEGKATVVVVAFEDFQSAASAKHVADVEPVLLSKYVDAGQVRWVVSFFPVSAPRAAVAAVCAARQGKFWEYRALLYQRQAEWTAGDDGALVTLANELKLDSSAFTACLGDAQVQYQVDNSLEFAQLTIGVPSAPSYLILKMAASGQVEDGKGYPGDMGLEGFETAIKEYLEPQSLEPSQLAPVAQSSGAQIPVGVDADGHFYRGETSALVRVDEFSDFQ